MKKLINHVLTICLAAFIIFVLVDMVCAQRKTTEGIIVGKGFQETSTRYLPVHGFWVPFGGRDYWYLKIKYWDGTFKQVVDEYTVNTYNMGDTVTITCSYHPLTKHCWEEKLLY